MKPTYTVLLLPIILLVIGVPAQAQLWKKIKDEAKSAIDKGVKPASSSAAKPASSAASDTTPVRTDKSEAQASEATSAAGRADYANYDFVAGDRIIFQPDFSGEADGELPSYFTVTGGKAEMQTLNNQKVLHLEQGTGACVIPMMNSLHYLPDQFTVEFDILFEGLQVTRFDPMMDFLVNFHMPEDQNYNGYPRYNFRLAGTDRCYWGGQPFEQIPASVKASLATPGVWHHIAIYMNKALGKVYIDQYRLAATNAVPRGAGHLAIRSNGRYGVFIKDVSIAEGGDDKYKKIVTDGKFITHGILFDFNKATIKPASTGALKEIAALMKAHTDLQFEIDGHTDSDGSPDANLRLSQQRADAVKAALVQMGIEAGRLTTKGFGASKPMDTNGTAEGKANNRRVEFVRQGARGASTGAEGAGAAGRGTGTSGAISTGGPSPGSAAHNTPSPIAGKTAGASRRPCCWIASFLCQARNEEGTVNVLRKGDGTVWTFRPGQELEQVPGLTDVIAMRCWQMA